MGIYRSNDPAVFDDLDGIVVDETAPAPSIKGVGTNTVIMVGQFERGPENELTSLGSTGELKELFGDDNTQSGNKALKNKKFANLKVIRAVASAAAKSSHTFDKSGTDVIKFEAKYKGSYGDNIKVTVEAGSDSGSKYTIEDTNSTAVLPKEVYDNIEIDKVTAETPFEDSDLVDVTIVDDTSGEPDTASATALSSGSDGTIADTDYETAIKVAEAQQAGNVLFLDDYNATRNGYLKTHAANTQDKMVIMSASEGDTVSAAKTAVGNQRDSDGRIIYVFNWVRTVIDGSKVYQSPASWMASILSQTHPSIDPAYAQNTQFLAGVVGLKQQLSRSDYIDLVDNGICPMEYDGDIGYKFKAGVVTQIANSSKTTILRRRMADFLSNSIAKYLKNYQNAPNTSENRKDVKGAILDFVGQQERLGVLPKDSEVNGGDAKLVDTESLNTDSVVAAGKFFIKYRQRIYSAMRYIVLRAEIGESVVVSAD